MTALFGNCDFLYDFMWVVVEKTTFTQGSTAFLKNKKPKKHPKSL